MNGAQNNDKVLCGLCDNNEYEIYKIIDNIKSQDKSLISDLLKRNCINPNFDEKVLKYSEKISSKVDDTYRISRDDLTDEFIFTIDSYDTKDMDDAISIKKKNEEYVLSVHIADVSHYVLNDTLLDKVAEERGCSIYLVDNVIPMLPNRITSDICSIIPNVNRLAITTEMTIDKNGRVISYRIFKSVVKSKAKLNYDEVSKYLDENDINFIIKYPQLIESLNIMRELKDILYNKRLKDGFIDLVCKKTKIYIKNSRVVHVEEYKKKSAHGLIEEFMLICNEVIARHCNSLNIPFIYRVHEQPKVTKLESLKNYLDEEDTYDISPKKIQNLLKTKKNAKDFVKINFLILKSMQQARYSPVCIGHYGLGKKYYCHFTSPIRRYPDLLVQRILKGTLEDRLTERDKEAYEKKVVYAAKQASCMERVAQYIEHEYKNIKHIEYLSKNIGKMFNGKITNIEENKINIILDSAIEGTCEINIKDYILDNNKKETIAVIGGSKYEIGDNVKLKLIKANRNTELLEFRILKKL